MKTRLDEIVYAADNGNKRRHRVTFMGALIGNWNRIIYVYCNLTLTLRRFKQILYYKVW